MNKSNKNKKKNKEYIQSDIKSSENMNITTPEVSSNNENNNPPISIRGNIPFPPGTMLIYINEYNNLIKENNDLKTQIANIQHKQLELLTTITSNTQTIDELKKENELLKEQITELKLENSQLKECNSNLISRMDKMENNALFAKYKIAIQDINRECELETKISKKCKLNKLRQSRVNDCHYIDDTYDVDEKNKYRLILYDRLINIPNSVKNIMETRYPGLIKEILPYIKNGDCSLSNDDIEIINDWWDM
jgi:hypothetical protein